MLRYSLTVPNIKTRKLPDAYQSPCQFNSAQGLGRRGVGASGRQEQCSVGQVMRDLYPVKEFKIPLPFTTGTGELRYPHNIARN